MKLHEVPSQSGSYRIRSIHVAHPESAELERLGLLPGAVIQVLHNDFRGTLGICFRGELIILGRSETFKIHVVETRTAEV